MSAGIVLHVTGRVHYERSLLAVFGKWGCGMWVRGMAIRWQRGGKESNKFEAKLPSLPGIQAATPQSVNFKQIRMVHWRQRPVKLLPSFLSNATSNLLSSTFNTNTLICAPTQSPAHTEKIITYTLYVLYTNVCTLGIILVSDFSWTYSYISLMNTYFTLK